MINNISENEMKKIKELGYKESFIRDNLIGKVENIIIDKDSVKIVRKKEWIDLNSKFTKRLTGEKPILDGYRGCLVVVQELKKKKLFSSHFSGPITLQYEIRNKNTGALVYKNPIYANDYNMFQPVYDSILGKNPIDGVRISKKTNKWYKRITEDSINNKIDEAIKECKYYYDPDHHYIGYDALKAIADDYNKPVNDELAKVHEEVAKINNRYNKELDDYNNLSYLIKNNPFNKVQPPVYDTKAINELRDKEMNIRERLIELNKEEYYGVDEENPHVIPSDQEPFGIIKKKMTLNELISLKNSINKRVGHLQKPNTTVSKDFLTGVNQKPKGFNQK